MSIMLCTSCAALVGAGRYSNLCRACDPAATPAPRCVAPLRCYCPTCKGRATRQVSATVAHRYGYNVATVLAGKVGA